MKRSADYRRIGQVVATVRRRWRLRVAVRGLAIAGGFTLAVLLLAALTLERLRFVPEAVVWMRVLTWSTLTGTVAWFLLRPLFRRVTDRQVALYLEEHEPSLEHVVASALDVGASEQGETPLGRRLMGSAVAGTIRVARGRRVEQARLYRLGGALTAVVVAALAFVLLGPTHLRIGVGVILHPLRDAAAVNPYAVSVTPADTTIARGTDQTVTAALVGFDAEGASIFTRTGPDAPFQRLSMIPAEGGGFEILLLGVSERTEYFVESTGVRSPTFTLDVADLPYVDRIDLTYRFPSYTGLAPRTVEDGGDVAALEGTTVEVRVTPTFDVPAGRLVVDGQARGTLDARNDGTLVGSFRVSGPGFYSIDLGSGDGSFVAASPEYAIDVLADQPPSIRFRQPGRDTQASPIEEVYLEVGAEDDYGVGDVRFVYSVNGEAEDTVSIFRASGAPRPELSVGHTLFLEEWPLEPGDLVSYYALVRDARGGDAPTISSDMYFLDIRPFERTYRQGEDRGGQQRGGNQGSESAMSELQRQIIAATFNLVRQREAYDAGEFSENVVSVTLAQERLREQVSTLVEEMRTRGLVETDEAVRDVSVILPEAIEAMDEAHRRLDREELREALPHEQRALRYLQQAEETYERTIVQQQAQAGGGTSGDDSSQADELADLFELELDKLKNQYETVRRGEQQQADDQVDATLEKLKELARRQEQEVERQSRRAQQGSSAGGGQTQRELAEETEQAARELQRLARETGNEELEEAARGLQEAADAMRRSAAAPTSEGTAESNTARQRLDEARRRLDQVRQDRARRDAERALEQVEELTEQQREVQQEVRALPAPGPERADQIARLRERKDQMTETVAEMERALDRAAAGARTDQPEAARRLEDAADQIRESKLKEKLQFSKGTVEQWDEGSATTLEVNIEADLRALRARLEEAAAATAERETDPLAEALEQTRNLLRGVEGSGPPSGADARQAQRTFREREAQARDLEARLDEAGQDTEALQAALEAIQRLQRPGTYGNPEQVAALESQIVDALRRIEFGLRRQVEGAGERTITLTGSDDVPDAYRKLVEEYYRKLATDADGSGNGSGN